MEENGDILQKGVDCFPGVWGTKHNFMIDYVPFLICKTLKQKTLFSNILK